jgi:lipopolysaccharide biosynthesis glycosyltransferase
MEDNPITIVFAINEKFRAPFSVTLKSLLDSNPTEYFSIYLLYEVLDSDDFDKIQSILPKENGVLQFIKINKELFENLPTPLHLPQAAYYRLLIPNLIPTDKVLYLDSDMLINGEIRPMWETDLGDNYLAAILEFSKNWHPKLPFNKEFGYFNSGVLLINSSLWRKNRYAERVLEFARSFPELIFFADQCALNATINGQFKILDAQWNFQAFFYEKGFVKPKQYSSEQFDRAIKNPKIIHYSGSLKPWHWGCKHPYRFQYWKKLYRTPYRTLIPDNLSLANIIRFISPKILLGYGYTLKNKFKTGLFK